MDWLRDNMDEIANVIEIVTFFVAVSIWFMTTRINQNVRLEKKRREKQVAIRLVNGNLYYELPVKLRGSEVARGEILGRIGMIPIDQNNKLTDRGFLIEYISSEAFIRRINEIQDETNNTILEISCNDKEYLQFKYPKS